MSKNIKFIGLWPRICALIVDLGLFALLMSSIIEIAEMYLGKDPLLLFFLYLSVPFLFFIYNILFHGIWGQTLGKMVMRIKLYTTQFREIDLRHAVLRDSIALSLQILSVFGIIMAMQQLPSNYLSPELIRWPASYVAKLFSIAQANNPLATALQVGYLIWGLVIFFTIMRSRYKRSINDQIGGTVMVKVNY